MSARAVSRGTWHAEEPEWVVWLTVVLALLIGFGIRTAVVGRTETVQAGPTMITYPATWVQDTEEGALFAATDFDSGSFGARAEVRQVSRAELAPIENLSGPVVPEDVAINWSILRGADLEGYRVLEIVPVAVQGREALQIDYVYLVDAPLAGAGALPGLIHAIDTIVPSGEAFLVLTVAVDASEDATLPSLNDQLLAGWRIP
jgi:hypothetical protein